MFTFRGPHIVMSRTDAQNGLDFHFNVLNKKESKVICMREFEIILFETQSLSIKPKLLKQ
jgi:hypothetical protein